MLRPILAAAALVALAGCAELGYGSGGPWDASRGPSDRRTPTYGGRADDYRRTSEYRRVASDAASYARYVDRNLRLGGGQEAAIRQIVERRAVDLLQRTRPRDHARVYPFPRASGRHAAFWSGVDREIERRLDSRAREDYRYLVRYGEARSQDRARSRGDDRYDDRPGRWGRDDGERDRPGSRRHDRDDDDRDDDDDDDRRDRGRDRGRDRDDDRRDDRGRADRDDRGRRAGESLEEWYRRQTRRP